MGLKDRDERETIECGNCLGGGGSLDGELCHRCHGSGELRIEDVAVDRTAKEVREWFYYKELANLSNVGLVLAVLLSAIIVTLSILDIVPAVVSLLAVGVYVPPLVTFLWIKKRKMRALRVGNCWHCGGELRPSDGPTEYECKACSWNKPDDGGAS